MAAAPGLHADQIVVIAAAFAGFCIQQPINWLIKIRFHGKRQGGLPVAAGWGILYTAVLLAAAVWLVARGHGWVLPVGIAGAAVLLWRMMLVLRKEERHHPVLDVIAALALAAAGPAAYWAGGGTEATMAALVWLLPGLQSSGSIVHMFVRLEQRRWNATPGPAQRLRRASVPLAHHIVNLIIGAVAVFALGLQWLALAAFLIVWVEGLHAAIRPPVRFTIRRIGMRQLFVSTIFILLLGAAFWLT